MAYLIPYSMTLPAGEGAVFPAFVIKDHAGIPDDTYQMAEWYCPNPDCHCNQAHIQIVAEQQKVVVGQVEVPLNTPLMPLITTEEMSTPYAAEVINLVTDYLQNQPRYLNELRDHYQQVKTIAADEQHPAYHQIAYYAEHGEVSKPGRKRHKK